LVAEIASCYIAAEIGMRVGNVDQHGAYLRHWLTRMNHDTGYIVRASAQASRVTDYLLSTANLRRSGAPSANDTQTKV
jgi:antirestriction protein ArdC